MRWFDAVAPRRRTPAPWTSRCCAPGSRRRCPPADFYAERPGRWVAEPAWPPPSVRTDTLALVAARPTRVRRTTRGSPESCRRVARGPKPAPSAQMRGSRSSPDQSCGLAAGVWCANGLAAELAIDQGYDDERSLLFETATLTPARAARSAASCGWPSSATSPQALLAVRLCAVAEDGASTLLSWGALNLTPPRRSRRSPIPLVPGARYDVDGRAQRDRRARARGTPAAARDLLGVLAAALAFARARSADHAHRRRARACSSCPSDDAGPGGGAERPRSCPPRSPAPVRRRHRRDGRPHARAEPSTRRPAPLTIEDRQSYRARHLGDRHRLLRTRASTGGRCCPMTRSRRGPSACEPSPSTATAGTFGSRPRARLPAMPDVLPGQRDRRLSMRASEVFRRQWRSEIPRDGV